MSIRQNILNTVAIRVKGINLSNFKNLRFYIRQFDVEYEFEGAVSSYDNEVMWVYIPKNSALSLKNGLAKWQIAITDSTTNEIRTHDPITFKVGEFIWRDGYGG